MPNIVRVLLAAASLFALVACGEKMSPGVRTLQGTREVVSLAFSPDGLTLAVGSDNLLRSGRDDSTLRLWYVTTGEMARTFRTDTLIANAVAFSPDGGTLASAEDRDIALWDPHTGAKRRVLSGGSGVVDSLAFSPDGSTLAAGDRDGAVTLWNFPTGTIRVQLRGHVQSASTLAFGPFAPITRRILATGDYDGTVRLWEYGSLRAALTGHTGPVRGVAFSPDGATLASGDDDTIILRDTATWAVRAVLTGNGGAIWSLAFRPDGRTLASGSRNGSAGTLIVWDVATGGRRATLPHEGGIGAVAFGPDGATLAVGGTDANVQLWDVRRLVP